MDKIGIIQEDRYKDIIDNIPVVAIAVSLEDKVSVEYINECAPEKVFLISAKEFRKNNVTIFDLVHEDDLDKVFNFYTSIIEKEYQELEYRVNLRNGQARWVCDTGEVKYEEGGIGNIKYICHSIRDVTDRKIGVEKLEKTLKTLENTLKVLGESEARYRDIFDDAIDAIYVVDLKGNIKDMNQAGIDLFGFSDLEHALNSNIENNYLDIENRKHVIETIDKEGKINSYLVEMKTLFGENINVVMTAGAKVSTYSGEIDSYQVIVSDIGLALKENEAVAYRRTMRGIADRVNNYSATYINYVGIIDDCLREIEENPSSQERNLKDLRDYVSEFKRSLANIRKFGRMLVYSSDSASPPDVTSDGNSGEGMYNLKEMVALAEMNRTS